MPRRFTAGDAMRRFYVPRPRKRPLVSTERGMEIPSAFTAQLPAYNRRRAALRSRSSSRTHRERHRPAPCCLVSTGRGRHLIAVAVARACCSWTMDERARLVKSSLKRASLPSLHPQRGINDRALGNCVFNPRAFNRELEVAPA
jgi:hypothetical protein